MRRWPRRLRRAALGLGLGLAALAGLAAFRVTRFPEVDGTRRVALLDGPIEIVRGPYGVPHVLATTPGDAYFGLGYCEAQDRTLQLEIFRRAANGTVAELIGEPGLEIDRFVRTVGIPRIAERQAANGSPEARALADRFCAGIDAGLRSLEWRPPELAALGAEPGPWTTRDCVALSRLLSYGLGEGARTQVLYARLADRLGEERTRALLPPDPTAPPPDGRVRRDGGRPVAVPGGGVLAGADDLRRLLAPAAGCSNWIVGPARIRGAGGGALGREDRAPIFAYDSHQVGPRIPGEVYLVHLVGGERLDVMGGAIVGLPGMYAGVTRDLAFAPTNVGARAQDLIVVELDPERPGHYRVDGGRSLPFETRVERIAVRGRKEPVALEVRETVYGPVVSDVVGAKDRVLALRWAGARPELRVDGYVTMPLARTFEDFRAALDAFEGASQHMGFAHRDGTIAYQVTEPVPRRTEPPPPWPCPPSALPDPEPPLLGLDELPHLVQPKDGFIATANHRPFAADRPFHLGRTFIPPARHDRLVERLEGAREVTLADVEAVGQDLVSTHARRVAPNLARALERAVSAEARDLGTRLAAWDHRMTADGLEPLLYHALYAEVVRAVLEDDLGPELLAEWAEMPDLSKERIAAILAAPEAFGAWIDDGRTADRREALPEVVEGAALAALARLEAALGRDRARWRYGALHRVTFEHYLHGLTSLLDDGPHEVPGDEDTVFRFGERGPVEPFLAVRTVALLRLLADLGDPSAIHASISTGQSGWAFHPHAKDQVPLFLSGRRIRIPRDVAAIRAEARATLRLEPAR